jgi:hypothetical protein
MQFHTQWLPPITVSHYLCRPSDYWSIQNWCSTSNANPWIRLPSWRYRNCAMSTSAAQMPFGATSATSVIMIHSPDSPIIDNNFAIYGSTKPTKDLRWSNLYNGAVKVLLVSPYTYLITFMLSFNSAWVYGEAPLNNICLMSRAPQMQAPNKAAGRIKVEIPFINA